MYLGLHVKYVFLSDFNENFSLDSLRKILKYRISWKYAQREQSYSKRTDGDMTNLNVAFSNFAKRA